MKLTIKNFAKIKEAEIKIDGITVIAGENNTGKSTVGKILFSMFNSLDNIDAKIKEQRIHEIENACRYMLNEHYAQSALPRVTLHSISYSTARVITRRVSPLLDTGAFLPKNIYHIVLQSLESALNTTTDISPEDIEIANLITEKIISVAQLPEEEILPEIISRYFFRTFHGQINSLTQFQTVAEVSLEIKSKKLNMLFDNNHCVNFAPELWLVHKAIYIDNPFILDSLNDDFSRSITESFIKSLIRKASENNIMDGVIESVLTKGKLDELSSKLQTIVDGDIVQKKNTEYFYETDKLISPLKLANLSTGLKSFVLIKLLLEKGIIKEKDVLILDEPEIHLHPQWQIAYAEIIVLLQKYFDLSIIVATHSPYFLDAINLFSIKHGVADKANYYLSSSTDEGVTMELVTSELDKIYKKMASPIQELETLRYELNNNQ